MAVDLENFARLARDRIRETVDRNERLYSRGARVTGENSSDGNNNNNNNSVDVHCLGGGGGEKKFGTLPYIFRTLQSAIASRRNEEIERVVGSFFGFGSLLAWTASGMRVYFLGGKGMITVRFGLRLIWSRLEF